MVSAEIRKKFVHFFVNQGHTYVPSSSLIPAQDPTLLFANAGMNQFKDVFLGSETRNYTRAVSVQKCIRAGGKHNDLDQVGFTRRHLTFFEMLGNFSFGDYFKEDAIAFAWRFLTTELNMNPAKLWVSVFRDDDEAYNIWHQVIGLPKDRIFRLGEADNFWQMGDTGPCGPCSEIYVDTGVTKGCGVSSCGPGCSCDRFLEIWNLVFMQFDKQPDGSTKPLAHKGVDTGMGLDRLCAVLQGKESVFETDLFMPIINAIERLTGKQYASSSPEDRAAFRVLADHIRSASFAIADGCYPSNEGRGYVVRKIIRRALLFSQRLSPNPFFPELYHSLTEIMGQAYPELVEQGASIVSILKHEVEKFAKNLILGQSVLEKYMITHQSVISGEQAFKLYDTYGFPLELTKIIAQQAQRTVDVAGFEREMEHQRQQSSAKKSDRLLVLPDLNSLATVFTGYDECQTEAQVTGLVFQDQCVNIVQADQQCWLITDKSPFYAECGGQVSDKGYVVTDQQSISPVLEVKKIGKTIALLVVTPHSISVHDSMLLIVDRELRIRTMKNHTATHLLQSSLIAILGKQVKQAGSLVAPDYLRFDFTYHEQLSQEDVRRVEDLVNQKIMENIDVCVSESTLSDAVSQGVIAFFGEKYNPEKVRVVAVPGFSAELCGGTHVRATGDIGCFKITEVTSLSAGSRRIVALTGPGALRLFQNYFGTIKNLSQELKMQPEGITHAVLQQKETIRACQTELSRIRKKMYLAMVPQWTEQVEDIRGIPYGYIELEDAAAAELRDIAHELAKKKAACYLIVSRSEGRVSFVLSIEGLRADLSLPSCAAFLAEMGLKGGVSKTMIQGGAKEVPSQLKQRMRDLLLHVS